MESAVVSARRMLGASTVLGCVTFVACGGAILPADFSGPPAAQVSGNVQRGPSATPDAERPKLSLEWLSSFEAREAAAPLVGQALAYERSPSLDADWNIDLALPAGEAIFEQIVGTRRVRLGVSKVVYYDDRTGDGRLDWSCDGAGCDRVRSVSSEFVVYVDVPPVCPASSGTGLRPRLSTGYHYFSFDPASGAILELGAMDSLNFDLVDRAPVAADPTADLRNFTSTLLQLWTLGTLQGC